MTSPRERLQAVAESFTPSKVVLRASYSGYSDEGRYKLSFHAAATSQMSFVDIGDKLQATLVEQNVINETWVSDKYEYTIGADAVSLFECIKRTVAAAYDNISKRCPATRNKTIKFLHTINLDTKHLPNYLIEMYIQLNTDEFITKSTLEKQAFFEPLESLRKTYGKRS